jgi:preprotein translocase subunit SecY
MARKLLITFALIALFRVVALLPLPGVDTKVLESIGVRTDRMNVMSLGLQPLVTSFVIVELWSFVFARGLELRRGGAAGRRKLNRSPYESELSWL